MKEQKIVLIFVGFCFWLGFFFFERDEAAKLISKVDRAISVATVFYLTCSSQNSNFFKHKMQLIEPSCLEKNVKHAFSINSYRVFAKEK